MINGKIRTKAHITGEKAIKFIQNEILPETWVSREITPDYGIDLDVELFDYENDRCITLGEHIFLQVKGTESPTYGNYTGEKETKVIKFQLEVSELNLVEKMGSAMPVLLVVVDLKNSKAFQVCLNDYIRKILRHEKFRYKKQKTIVINIPIKNEISKESINVLSWYGKRTKIYAMFHEMLVDIEDMKYMNNEERIIFAKEFCEYYRQYNVFKYSELWSGLKHIKILLEEMIENDGMLQEISSYIRKEFDEREDLDDTNLIKKIQIMSINRLSKIIINYSGMFETYCREWFMPGLLLGN